MATVEDLVNRVAKLGLGEDEPDATEQALYLSFIQSVHDRVYGEVAKSYPTALLDSQEVEVTDGEGELDPAPFIIMQVTDTDNAKILEPTDLLTLEQENPDLDDTGTPDRFYVQGNMIGLDTDADTTLRVRHIPMPSTLTLTTELSALFIPAPFVDLLLWGAITQLAYDERDKGLVVEAQLCMKMYDQFFDPFWTWLAQSQPKQPLYVKACLP